MAGVAWAPPEYPDAHEALTRLNTLRWQYLTIALLLHAGFSRGQIAARIGTPVAHVRVALGRMRTQLRAPSDAAIIVQVDRVVTAGLFANLRPRPLA